MPTYNLPAVDYDPIPAPTSYGHWENATNLRGLAKALRAATPTSRIDQIKSIPDAWAQVQLSGQALTDPSHELHEEVVGQWRGLLALFALQPMFSDDYDLEIRTLKLSDHGGGQSKLRQILDELVPTMKLTPGVSWDDVGVVMFRDKSARDFAEADGVPIGLLSPWTLLSPAKGVADIHHPGLPWMTDGLADPLKAGGLSPDHYAVLANYLKTIASGLTSAGTQRHDTALHNEIQRRLQIFHDKCRDRAIDDPKMSPVRRNLDWPSPFYAILGETFTIEPGEAGESWSRLAIRPELAALFRGVILVDQDLQRTFKLPPESIRIWKRMTLRDAMSPAVLARIKSEAAAEGFLVIEPDDLFTTTLVRFNAGVDIPAHPQTFRDSLLPFSPLALMLLDRDGLARDAVKDDRGAGAYDVRLNLTLHEDARRPGVAHHELIRTYTKDHIRREDMPDDLGIWPNFQTPSWRWTFINFQYDPEYELQPRFAISADFVAADVGRAQSPTDRAHTLLEWASPTALKPDKRLFVDRTSEVLDAGGELLLRRIRYRAEPRLVGEMQQAPRGVEAIFFAGREDGRPGSEQPLGCVLIRPEPIIGGHADAVVSIDFGTTNTIAYMKRGENRTPVKFGDRVLFPIQMTHNEPARRKALMDAYIDFFPLRDGGYPTPIPTVAKVRDFRGNPPPTVPPTADGGHDAHGFSDTIFFAPGYEGGDGATSIFDWIRANQLLFDLKWREDQPSRRLARRFLRQFMMMTAAELAAEGVAPNRINWRFSYPQAFKNRHLREFTTSLRTAWTDLFGARDRLEVAPLTTETEGAAAVRYFTEDAEQENRAGSLLVMLDIGGRTTDVAIWLNNQLCWRDSFEIAGGHFFTRYLANNLEILRKIGFGEVAAFIRDGAGGSPESAANFVELFVNAPRFNSAFARNFSELAGEPEGVGLRQCASVALGGLMHYVGLVLGEALATPETLGQNAILPTDLETLTVAFGGRGSALFNQLKGAPGEDNELEQLCGILVAAAGRNPADVRITTLFSPQPKHEVARGLLIPPKGRDDKGERWPFSPLGQTVQMGAGAAAVALGPTAPISALIEANNAGEEVRSLSLDGLTEFLISLKRQTGIGVDLKSFKKEGELRVSRGGLKAVRSMLGQMSSEDLEKSDTKPLEPPFISSLRALIELMSKPIDERKGIVAVTETLE